jgi:hypothetical protein
MARGMFKGAGGRLLGILLAAATVRLAIWSLLPDSRFASDEESYYRTGLALLETGRLDPFWPPVTGWIIAAAFGILQTTSVSALRLLWVLLDLGCLVAVHRLATQAASSVVGNDARAAGRFIALVTLAYALYLPAISFSQFTTSETPALLQLLIVLVILSRADAGVHAVAAAGLVCGTLVLTRPSLLPLLLALPLAALPAWRRASRAKHAASFILAGAAVVGSLVAWNWWRLGQPTIAQNSAYNLYIGNRDFYAEDLNLFAPRATEAQIEFRRRFRDGSLEYPAASPSELERAARDWILANPGTFARRALGRLARVFAPKTDVLELVGGEHSAGVFAPPALSVLGIANLQWLAVLAGGIPGLFMILRAQPHVGRLFVMAIAGSVLLTLAAISKPRYAFVFEPLLILAAIAFFTRPREALAAMPRAERLVVVVMFGFLAWAWVAWTIFSITSRLALAEPG